MWKRAWNRLQCGVGWHDDSESKSYSRVWPAQNPRFFQVISYGRCRRCGRVQRCVMEPPLNPEFRTVPADQFDPTPEDVRMCEELFLPPGNTTLRRHD